VMAAPSARAAVAVAATSREFVIMLERLDVGRLLVIGGRVELASPPGG
jgi:hypothetical protein